MKLDNPLWTALTPHKHKPTNAIAALKQTTNAIAAIKKNIEMNIEHWNGIEIATQKNHIARATNLNKKSLQPKTNSQCIFTKFEQNKSMQLKKCTHARTNKKHDDISI